MGDGKQLHGQELADAMNHAAGFRSDGDAGLLAWGAAEIERLRAAISDHRDSVVGRVITIDRANGLLWQAVE